MASEYKLTYFNITGFAEPIRYLFNYGGIKFEDVRVEFDEWEAIKPTMPFGQMPILEHNGKVIGQSIAITRYVGKLVKLDGKNDWENLEIDAIADTVREFHMKTAMYYYETDETKKESLKETLVKETVAYFMERFNNFVKKNNGYLAAGHLSWVDILFASSLENINVMMEMDVIANYPELGALKKKIEEIPNIKRYLETRPKTIR